MVRAMNSGAATVTDASAVEALAHALQIHPLVARVLVGRGYTRPDATRSFLSPKLAELTRPDAMADRDAAAERLAAAVRSKERIVVFGDYDVDGITSAALITRALRAMGGDVSCLVASRFDGGYGLSDAALDRVLALDPKVLITCDCGTSDHPRLERARQRGVDAIVVDHHKVPDEALPVVAFLNPHRSDCRFPYKHMASVGLAFSIAAAVRARLGVALDLREYLDLVALGTIADVAPLDGDNRTLTRHGLERIADGHGGPGVRALLAESKLRFRLVARDVAFSLAPMLNAPGRLGPATPTLELLLSETDRDAQPRAFALAQANLRRREISAQLVDAAIAQAHALHGDHPPAGVVLAGDGWHAGMGGIVAGRLVERLQAAVCVIAIEGDLGVGSVRAPRGTKLYDAVYACRDLLVGFGGHDAAAGGAHPPGAHRRLPGGLRRGGREVGRSAAARARPGGRAHRGGPHRGARPRPALARAHRGGKPRGGGLAARRAPRRRAAHPGAAPAAVLRRGAAAGGGLLPRRRLGASPGRTPGGAVEGRRGGHPARRPMDRARRGAARRPLGQPGAVALRGPTGSSAPRSSRRRW